MPSPLTATGRSRSRRLGFAVVAVLSALVCALGVAELGLRMLDLPKVATSFDFLDGILGDDASYVPDRERFWKLRPSPPWANELGLRGYLPSPGPGGERTLRIAVVGDSCTFGAHVRYEESYGMVLERLLRDALPNRHVETIVAGVPGYSTWQDRVLFLDHVAAFAPDVTVLYCGGWNDYVPALGESDRTRATSWRILRLLHGAGQQTEPTKDDRERRWQEFRSGEARDGRRVPLADFEDNLRAMVDSARAFGGKVVFVVPPLDEETFAQTRIAADYRAAVRRIAADLGAPALDAPALFANKRAELTATTGFPGTWPSLFDWVHPSTSGHRLIAAGLLQILRTEVGLLDAAPGPGPRVDAVDQSGSVISIRGQGFVTTGIERLFAGPWWIAEVEQVTDGSLRARIPPGLPPGRQPLMLVGRFGTRPAGFEVEIPTPKFTAQSVRDEDGALHVTLTCEGPPGWRVHAWLAPTRAEQPEPTRHGEFQLSGAEDARPKGRSELPFLFERLKLDPIDGTFDANGAWRHVIDVGAPTAATLPATMFLQAIVFEPPSTGRAALTGLVELHLGG